MGDLNLFSNAILMGKDAPEAYNSEATELFGDPPEMVAIPHKTYALKYGTTPQSDAYNKMEVDAQVQMKNNKLASGGARKRSRRNRKRQRGGKTDTTCPSFESSDLSPVTHTDLSKKLNETHLSLQRINQAFSKTSASPVPASMFDTLKGGRRMSNVLRKLRRRSTRKAKGGTRSLRTRKIKSSRRVRRAHSAPSGKRRTRKNHSFKKHREAVNKLRGARRQSTHALARTLQDARGMGLDHTQSYANASRILANKRRGAYATGRRLLGLPV